MVPNIASTKLFIGPLKPRFEGEELFLTSFAHHIGNAFRNMFWRYFSCPLYMKFHKARGQNLYCYPLEHSHNANQNEQIPFLRLLALRNLRSKAIYSHHGLYFRFSQGSGAAQVLTFTSTIYSLFVTS